MMEFEISKMSDYEFTKMLIWLCEQDGDHWVMFGERKEEWIKKIDHHKRWHTDTNTFLHTFTISWDDKNQAMIFKLKWSK